MNASDPKKPALRCSKCDLPASGDLALIARAGGTHWRILTHAVGAPGRNYTRSARRCGTWIEDKEARNG